MVIIEGEHLFDLIVENEITGWEKETIHMINETFWYMKHSYSKNAYYFQHNEKKYNDVHAEIKNYHTLNSKKIIRVTEFKNYVSIFDLISPFDKSRIND